jgi:hypothetical protein
MLCLLHPRQLSPPASMDLVVIPGVYVLIPLRMLQRKRAIQLPLHGRTIKVVYDEHSDAAFAIAERAFGVHRTTYGKWMQRLAYRGLPLWEWRASDLLPVPCGLRYAVVFWTAGEPKCVDLSDPALVHFPDGTFLFTDSSVSTYCQVCLDKDCEDAK